MTLTINSTISLDNKLTSVANVVQELDISSSGSSAFITNLIKRASDMIESYTGRSFQKLDITETLQAQGQNKLLLSKRPVQSITAITFDGSTISSTTYEIDNKEAGILFRESGWTTTLLRKVNIEAIPGNIGVRDWSVRYIYGYELPNSTLYSASTAQLPDDVEAACIQAVKSMFQDRKQNPKIKKEKIGDAQVERFESVSEGPFNPTSLAILQKYREIV